MKKTFRSKLIIIFCIILIISLTGCSQENKDGDAAKLPLIAQTDKGAVSGEIADDILTFKGVPFAKAPVGDLRFAPPQEMDPWDETLACTEFKAAPAQVHDEESKDAYEEDCLYLNIWAPDDALENPKESKLPVHVFIHGGAYATGTASKATFGGAAFAKDGIIQVNLEYRVNVLGFLALEELEEETGYKGNIGVLDQIAGLKWVQANIENFGGDPANVTINGESAGSMSVSNLIMSPMAEGLFNRAIMESGSLLGQPILSPSVTGDKEQGMALGESYKQAVGAKTIEDLRNMDVDTLVNSSAFNSDMTKPTKHGMFPIFDGKIIPEDPYTALKTGKYNDVDILAGFNTDEGTMFIPENITEEAYIGFVESIFKENTASILEMYPVDEANTPTDQARRIIAAGFQIGCYAFGDELSKQGKNIYLYNFDYHIPALEEKGLGVMHGSEMFFVFKSAPSDLELPENSEEFTENVHNYWVSFIKTGDPNSGGDAPNWPKYSHETNEIIRLGETIESIPAPYKNNLDYILGLFWK